MASRAPPGMALLVTSSPTRPMRWSPRLSIRSALRGRDSPHRAGRSDRRAGREREPGRLLRGWRQGQDRRGLPHRGTGGDRKTAWRSARRPRSAPAPVSAIVWSAEVPDPCRRAHRKSRFRLRARPRWLRRCAAARPGHHRRRGGDRRQRDDRPGRRPDTVIGDGARIDNLVQIGHNVQLGRGCVLVAQSGVAGQRLSSRIT